MFQDFIPLLISKKPTEGPQSHWYSARRASGGRRSLPPLGQITTVSRGQIESSLLTLCLNIIKVIIEGFWNLSKVVYSTVNIVDYV